MKRRVMVAGLVLALGACANGVNQGLTHYNAGQYDQAAAQWNSLAQQGDPAAQNNLGLLWKDGLGSTPKDLNQAAEWFLKAARQGLPIGMVNLAKVQLELNQPDPALTWLTMAARWNNAEAIGMLRSMGAPIPAPDLHQTQQRQLAVQQQQASQNFGQGLGFLACAAAGDGAGCAQPTVPQRIVSQPQQRAPVRNNAPQQHALMSQQTDLNWNRTCRYADGTVISVGQKQCPPAIAGQF